MTASSTSPSGASGCFAIASPATQVVLRNSQRCGDELQLNTDRRFLVRSAQLGFHEIELHGSESPIVCRDERRVYLWSVLADGPTLEAGADTVQLDSPITTTDNQSASRSSGVTDFGLSLIETFF